MNITPVKSESPIPLYYQVESDLRRLIEEGALGPGAVVPPEHDLCAMYGVSRHTMRRALSRLVDDHLIERSAGRGTFVKPEAERARFYLDRSFTRQMEEMGKKPSSRILETRIGLLDESTADDLRAHSGAPFFHLVRLRLGDGEPIGIQYHTIITEQCPDLDQYDFSKASLYDVLATKYRLLIAEIRYAISALLADAEQARLLEIAPGDPLLKVSTTAFLDSGNAIEHTTSYYRADRYRYSTKYKF